MEIVLKREQQEAMDYLRDNADPVTIHSVHPTDEPFVFHLWVTWKNPAHGEAMVCVDTVEKEWFEL